MTESRDETHDSIDHTTGTLTAEALARRRELMPDVPAGAADWGWRYDQMLKAEAAKEPVADLEPAHTEEVQPLVEEPGLFQ